MSYPEKAKQTFRTEYGEHDTVELVWSTGRTWLCLLALCNVSARIYYIVKTMETPFQSTMSLSWLVLDENLHKSLHMFEELHRYYRS